jgi:hypothetical protein
MDHNFIVRFVGDDFDLELSNAKPLSRASQRLLVALFWCGLAFCSVLVSRYTRGSPIECMGRLLAGYFVVRCLDSLFYVIVL